MRLIISHFLRTLRERDEYDRLLPDLLLSMGYVPLAKPQTGVRQYGVDLAAVGKSPVDGADELLLLVIKQGDLGRRDWDNGEPTAIRPSLNEVLDFYLTKLVAPEHSDFRKTVILATTGDLKQDVETNWTAFKELNSTRAGFDFWGADKVSDLIEQRMLDENLFETGDRSDFRKTLVLAADPSYDFRDFKNLLLRQLGMTSDGEIASPGLDAKQLTKAFRRIHLAARVCVHWAQADGNSKQALWIAERTMLWAWHRVQLIDPIDRPKFYSIVGEIWHTYNEAAAKYFDVISPHLHVRDGMAGYGSEGASFAVVLFEHMGLLSSIGLSCLFVQTDDDEVRKVSIQNASAVTDGLCALLENHGACASPRLDCHIIDISLALLLLVCTGRRDVARSWVSEIARRLHYSYATRSRFPVSTDSLEDLVELEVRNGDEGFVDDLMRTSWSLATTAAWCSILELDDDYFALANGAAKTYRKVCAQLWHPTIDWHATWYFKQSLNGGESEAPYSFLTSASEMRKRMVEFLAREEYDWMATSPSLPLGLGALDYIACRHFRMPVPASAWYRLVDVRDPKEVAGKPADKPTTKKGAAKPAGNRAAKKAPAKPAAKAAAKKAAANPAAKPAANKAPSKPTAKPATKKAAAKPAAKSAAKKAAAKPAAKPAAKKAPSKPADKPALENASAKVTPQLAAKKVTSRR